MEFLYIIGIFFLGIVINYLVIKNYKTLNLTILLDREYLKPQSFHKTPILCFGGSSLYILFVTLFFLKIVDLNFFLIISSAFFIGLLDDIKIKIKPLLRLILIFFLFFIAIYFSEINLKKTGIDYLDYILNENKFLSLFFIVLCFVFILNGSNFIDGFNGLLATHSLIILSILNLINFYFNNENLLFMGLFFFSCILSFLLFNFPKAKLFLGDSGSYLLGSLISYLIIQTSNLNPNISPFFFSCILYYLFFEVFFSFIRKSFFDRKNPLTPDRMHLHMLFFKNRNKKFNLFYANWTTGVYINFLYFVSLIPLILFYNSNLFSKYYFFILLLGYFYFYLKLRSK